MVDLIFADAKMRSTISPERGEWRDSLGVSRRLNDGRSCDVDGEAVGRELLHGPQPGKVEFDRIEGLCAHDSVTADRRDQQPSDVRAPVHLDRSQHR